jgi:hypothetical protein
MGPLPGLFVTVQLQVAVFSFHRALTAKVSLTRDEIVGLMLRKLLIHDNHETTN